MLFGLPDIEVKKLQQVFENDKRVSQVWLYGSRATGKQKAASDIDLCIEGAQLSLADLHSFEVRIDDLFLPWKVDLSLKHQIDNPALIQHIENVGIGFLSSRMR